MSLLESNSTPAKSDNQSVQIPRDLTACLRPIVPVNNLFVDIPQGVVDPKLQVLLLTYPAYVYQHLRNLEEQTNARVIFQSMYKPIKPVPGPNAPLKDVKDDRLQSALSLKDILGDTVSEKDYLNALWKDDSCYTYLDSPRVSSASPSHANEEALKSGSENIGTCDSPPKMNTRSAGKQTAAESMTSSHFQLSLPETEIAETRLKPITIQNRIRKKLNGMRINVGLRLADCNAMILDSPDEDLARLRKKDLISRMKCTSAAIENLQSCLMHIAAIDEMVGEWYESPKSSRKLEQAHMLAILAQLPIAHQVLREIDEEFFINGLKEIKDFIVTKLGISLDEDKFWDQDNDDDGDPYFAAIADNLIGSQHKNNDDKKLIAMVEYLKKASSCPEKHMHKLIFNRDFSDCDESVSDDSDESAENENEIESLEDNHEYEQSGNEIEGPEESDDDEEDFDGDEEHSENGSRETYPEDDRHESNSDTDRPALKKRKVPEDASHDRGFDAGSPALKKRLVDHEEEKKE